MVDASVVLTARVRGDRVITGDPETSRPSIRRSSCSSSEAPAEHDGDSASARKVVTGAALRDRARGLRLGAVRPGCAAVRDVSVAAQREVWVARLAPISGDEQAGTRPVVVISIDAFNTAGWGLCLAPLEHA